VALLQESQGSKGGECRISQILTELISLNETWVNNCDSGEPEI
jgi:hypothetical protein